MTELDVIAIDNLPSLLPLEASITFSGDLRGQLSGLRTDTAPWQRCLSLFHRHREL